jgi:uncharacterized membrane protein
VTLQSKLTNAVLWTCVILSAFVSAAPVLKTDLVRHILPFAFVTVLSIFTVVHGVRRYGWKSLLVLFCLTFVISWSYETCSILTGFPFGNYHYSENLGPKLWLVPLLIMPAYFSMGYIAWMIGHILLDRFDDRPPGADVILIPVFSSFAMVMWDLCMDPSSSTVLGSWVWHEGGAYFGVPFVNFLGWYLCVFTIYQAFALYLQGSTQSAGETSLGDRLSWAFPALMYGTVMLGRLIVPLTIDSKQVASLDRHVWWTGDIYASLALVSLFTMLFVTLLALVRVWRSSLLR